MTLRSLAKCALVALQVLGAISSPVDTSSSDTNMWTPGGLFQKSNTHLVPEGGKVVRTPTAVQLIGADGTILHTAPLTKSTPISPRRNVSGTPTTISPRALQTGWVAFGYWTPPSGPPITYFTTNWTVPSAPANWNGQTVYIFNALEPASSDVILQPVLQYGFSPAGGGQFWSIASWYVFSGGPAYFTSLIEVQPGQSLSGVMTNAGSTTAGGITSYLWDAYFFVDKKFNQGTSMTISTTEVLVWAYETLEIYDVSTAADLPTGSTVMSGTQIYTGETLQPTILWRDVTDVTDHIFTEVLSNGNFVIIYPTSG